MTNLGYLFAGFAVVWVGIALYLVRLNGQARELEGEIRELRRRLGD